jgi:5-bromo-4-chloroindolyl phosphate hydrolysis protein
MAMSRLSKDESFLGFEPDTDTMEKKLAVLEKSMMNHPKLHRKSSRTQILRSTRNSFYYNSNNPTDLTKAKQTLLTPLEQLSVTMLPQSMSMMILNTENNLKKLMQMIESVNSEHRKLRETSALG